MNTENLPLKEWYQLAEEQAALAAEMLKVARAIEELPDDISDFYKENIASYLKDSNYPQVTVDILWDQIEMAQEELKNGR